MSKPTYLTIDRKQLLDLLLRVCKWSGCLFLLLMPGSFLMLSLFAWRRYASSQKSANARFSWRALRD
jgi:hypothetical protein